LNHLKELGLDTQKAHKTALKLHAHSVLYAHKLTTTKRALEKFSCSQGLDLEQGAASHPPNCHYFIFLPGGGDSSVQCFFFSFIDVGSGFTA